MFQILPETKGNIIAIRMSGTVTPTDYERAVPKLEVIYDTSERFRLFIDWQALDGWEKGAKSASLAFLMTHRGLVERVAIVGDDRWGDEVQRVADIYKWSEVRLFPHADDAWEWLRRE